MQEGSSTNSTDLELRIDLDKVTNVQLVYEFAEALQMWFSRQPIRRPSH